jgi:hypothetical protein
VNRLSFVLDKTQEIRELIGGDAFNDVPNLEYEDLIRVLDEIEEEVLEVRDDGEFEDGIPSDLDIDPLS